MKRYKITLATPEQCVAKGLKFEGQVTRTQLWLMGVASGVSFMASHVPIEREIVRFNLMFTNNQYFYVQTNSEQVMDQVADYLSGYGCTIELA